MDGSKICLTKERKGEENTNNQVDKLGEGVNRESLHSIDVAVTDREKHDFETLDDTTENRGLFVEDEMCRKTWCDLGAREFLYRPAGQNRYFYDCDFALTVNVNCAPEVSEQRVSTLSGIMEELTHADIFIIGVYGTHNVEKANILEKVSRRAKRDNLFDKFVMANVTQKPDLKRIQGELAHALGFTMEEKSVAKRADLLRDRIKMERRILVILQDLYKGIDLDKVGIPFGENHRGCKILLTSTSDEILSNQMHAQKVFMA